MSSVIDSIERSQVQQGRPAFGPGDRVRVHFEVVEGNRRRTQVFEGVVLKRQGAGARETFTVRKQSFGVGVERVFPLHSPKIEKLEVAARGAVRRAKLYYLRDRVGKAARVAERRWGIDEDVFSAVESQDGSAAVDSEGATLSELEPEQAPAEAEAEAPEEAPEAEATEEPPEAEAEPEQAEEEPQQAEEEPRAEDAGDESPDEEPGDSEEEKA